MEEVQNHKMYREGQKNICRKSLSYLHNKDGSEAVKISETTVMIGVGRPIGGALTPYI